MVIIPIRLLWKVQMKPKQKFGLGFFLCLSVFMMMVAIVRISALRTKAPLAPGMTIDAIDPTWKLFWQQTEASIAVLMVSFTAFRSFFVTDTSRYPRERVPPAAGPAGSPVGAAKQNQWYSSPRRVWGNRKRDNSDDTDTTLQGSDKNGFPSIPRATMTGIRTFIRGGGPRSGKGDLDTDTDTEKGVMVTQSTTITV